MPPLLPLPLTPATSPAATSLPLQQHANPPTQQGDTTPQVDTAPAASIDIARFASGVTAVYGLSGAGKSSLADTAAEYVAERFGLRTMCIAMDPGGWGNRRMSLIRNGVMSVYDPSNHVDYFDTMEKLSKGAFPETILDTDRGYADPHVRLLFPRQAIWIAKCPNGHEAARYYHEAVMIASSATCPHCGMLVTVANQTTAKQIIRPKIFHKIGLRIFDSMTAMNDRGLVLELPKMSAAGELPVSRTGGSALGSADAVRQGEFVVGTSSEAQVGFMQNRTYGWLVNIRTIPDQIIGAICTFGVEESKDDVRGGELSYGPAISGKARTARVPGWVGNCLHATKEPDGGVDEKGLLRMRHRLWLSNHVDPRDISRRPYLAKHRGTPLGMPDFLEDPWKDTPVERAAAAWSICSLKYFFELLEQQYAEIAAADATRFAAFAQSAGEDEVLGTEAVATIATTAPPLAPGSGRALRPTFAPGMPAAGLPLSPAPPAFTPLAAPTPVRDEQTPALGTGGAGDAPITGAPVAAPPPAAVRPPAAAAPVVPTAPRSVTQPAHQVPPTAPAPPGPVTARPRRAARPPTT